jgi:glycosyltransferase involved in cell wall biosynthesis
MTAMNPAYIEISVVMPAFRCRECIPELHRRLGAALSKLTSSYELIFVDDASPTGDWEVIAELARTDPHVKGVKFSRNFGQHFALSAGLDHTRGDWVVIMDCDLQDQPEEIDKLYRKAKEGYDIVLALRQNRQDNALKRWLSHWFYRVLERLTDVKWDSRVGTFRIMSRTVVENFRSMREHLRFFGGMIQWLGFRTATEEVAHAPRFAGRSSYTLRSMLLLAVRAILSFSQKPLYVAVFLGLAIAAASFVAGTYLMARKIFFGIPVLGWASMMVSFYFMSGLILMNLGVIGFYVGGIFIETKGRPLYVVEKKVGL